MIVVGDTLGQDVAKHLGAEFVMVERREFPDGELCPRIVIEGKEKIFKGKQVVFILHMAHGQNPNSYLVEYVLAMDALHYLNVKQVTAVMPYFIYSRQHRKYLPGQTVSAKAIARALERAGAKNFITVNSHARSDLPGLFKKSTALDLNAVPLLAKHVAKKIGNGDFKNAIVVAPDKGAAAMAQEFAKHAGCRQWTAFEKTRDLKTGEIKMVCADVDFNGRQAVVVDDLVASGGTMVGAIRACRHNGASHITACFVHPVLCSNALEKLKAAADAVISTNSINSSVSEVDLSGLIAQAITK